MTLEQKREHRREYMKCWYRANPDWRKNRREKETQYQRQWRKANPGKDAEYSKRYRDTNPEKWKRAWRRAVEHRYGLGPGEYEALLAQQNGACAICKKLPAGKKRLAVDHDHTDKRVRGLLCNNCNNGLGRFKDDSTIIESALRYVRQYGR
jgi:Recombination endonuclease VII